MQAPSPTCVECARARNLNSWSSYAALCLPLMLAPEQEGSVHELPLLQCRPERPRSHAILGTAPASATAEASASTARTCKDPVAGDQDQRQGNRCRTWPRPHLRAVPSSEFLVARNQRPDPRTTHIRRARWSLSLYRASASTPMSPLLCLHTRRRPGAKPSACVDRVPTISSFDPPRPAQHRRQGPAPWRDLSRPLQPSVRYWACP
ncbi:hypothetical protein VPH35_044291 [Triticum aestivum]|uniref:uncharacterized protein n=1 Tax=Triticum aestivum TaxID=4565 RepID=UPI001D032886|nr:uncharacterized protein LOC123058299 [Triticum aestivum]